MKHDYILNCAGPVSGFDHYWELCVGSCHAATALREDYRQQLAKAHRDLGFKYVRFHGLFCDDMSVVTPGVGPMIRETPEDGLILSFTNTDSIIDFLLSIGMKPFVELGFMPAALTSGRTRIFHYDGHTAPPDDYNKWKWLVKSFAQHCIERYGTSEVRQWFFEVWNEPNLGSKGAENGFFGGDMEDYFKLYRYAAEAIKETDPALKVGGPATACNGWIDEFMQFCSENNVPYDFITTHHYPIDTAIQRLREESESKGIGMEQLIQGDELWKYVPRGVLTHELKEVREKTAGHPLYYTEWNSNAQFHSDAPFGASFAVKTCMDNTGMAEGYSYWTFSDIFEEGGLPHSPFHGGFGMMNLQGVPKAVYRGFEILHKLGDLKYDQTYSDGNVDIYAVKNETASSVQILAVNNAGVKDPVDSETVNITITGLQSFYKATVTRVDEEHGNAYAEWKQQGSPAYCDEQLHHRLMAASVIKEEPLEDVRYNSGSASLELTLPPQGLALVTVYC